MICVGEPLTTGFWACCKKQFAVHKYCAPVALLSLSGYLDIRILRNSRRVSGQVNQVLPVDAVHKSEPKTGCIRGCSKKACRAHGDEQ